MTNAIPRDIREEFEVVAEYVCTGKPLPLDFDRRIRERAQKFRLEIFKKHGLVDIAVPASRGLHDDALES